jgi:2-oxoisovalerate dehydrogenase E1 component subunit alpha
MEDYTYTSGLTFSVPFLQFLKADATLLNDLPESISDKKSMVSAYETMTLIRAFDHKAIALQRTGKLGTYPSVLGQEAMGTAIGMAMSKDDIFAPYYRDFASQYLRGVSLKEMLMYWGGFERASQYKNGGTDFPVCVPIATQCGHAAGAAVAIKTRGEHHASLVTCGEGATSKGDFLETLNLAGAWQLPLVMLVNNNQWAISTPRDLQCGAQTIAQKAVGAGIEGVVVDGNDYFALRYSLDMALEKAYAGKGATLIEAVSYRLGDHTTADDASRYRPDAELKRAWEKEPVSRLKKFLLSCGYWSEAQEKALLKRVKTQIEQAVSDYLAEEPDEPSAMFDYLFEVLPAPLEDQYAELCANTMERVRESEVKAMGSPRVEPGLQDARSDTPLADYGRDLS